MSEINNGTAHLYLENNEHTAATVELKNHEDESLTIIASDHPSSKTVIKSTSSVASSQTLTNKNSEVSEHSKSSADNSTHDREGKYTKVFYHIDSESTPYYTKVQVSPSKITLGDFKKVINHSNYKYYCKLVDQEVGWEVKAEIIDDSQILCKSAKGQFELFLLTTESSSHSGGTFGDPFKSAKNTNAREIPSFLNFNNLLRNTNTNKNVRSDVKERAPKTFFTSTMYGTESDRIFSDEESRLSTSTDNITSVSRQNHNFYRRRQRKQHNRRLPSRTSSLSSVTETSMALELRTVTLNMDSVGFLGISIVGQSSSKGDNGIYIADVMPGGAVALDGRIEPGDMILQVNDDSFEKFTNDQAVEALKQAVSKRGTIKLTVAKSLESDRSNYFTLPLREPVRPIDTKAWVQHTNAVRGVTGPAFSTMNSIPEGSEGAPTPIPGQFSMQQQPINHLSNFNCPPRTAGSNNSGGSGGSGIQQTIIGSNGMFMLPPQRLDVHTEPKKIVYSMAMQNSGLDIRDHTWLKIPIPMSFLGSSLVDWLLDHVEGLRDRKHARKYASALLKQGLISHVVNKTTFTEQCYYIFGDACEEFVQLRNPQLIAPSYQKAFGHPGPSNLYPMPMYFNGMNGQQQSFGIKNGTTKASMSGDYASMPPTSPYPSFIPSTSIMLRQNPPHLYLPSGVIGLPSFNVTPVPDMNSQASNNSNEESSSSDQRRKAILPPAPSLSSVTPNDPKFISSGGIAASQFLPEKSLHMFALKQKSTPAPTVEIKKPIGNNSIPESLRFRFTNDDSEFFVDHL